MMKTVLSVLFLAIMSSVAFAQKATYSIRIFNCDDACRAYVNDQLVGETGFAQDSGWIDISNRLGSGAAKLKFEVINRTGGIAYGTQVRVNGAVVINQICGRVGVVGCDNNSQVPAGVAKEFSYTVLTGADPGSDARLLVLSGGGTSVGIDQIAELNRGILGEPGSLKESPSGEDFLRMGRRFRLLFGGGEAGSLTITGKTKVPCGDDYEPVGTAQTSVRLGGQVRALATNSRSLGQRTSARRAPTASERAAALSLAHSIFRQRGVPAALLKSIETINLTATDLDGDGKFELIGSFSIQRGVASPYELFLLAKQAMLGFEPDLVFYYGNSSEWGQTLFIDQIDLDGDGTAELIVEKGYEPVANHIQIYKKQGGHWVVIYERPGWEC